MSKLPQRSNVRRIRVHDDQIFQRSIGADEIQALGALRVRMHNAQAIDLSLPDLLDQITHAAGPVIDPYAEDLGNPIDVFSTNPDRLTPFIDNTHRRSDVDVSPLTAAANRYTPASNCQSSPVPGSPAHTPSGAVVMEPAQSAAKSYLKSIIVIT